MHKSLIALIIGYTITIYPMESVKLEHFHPRLITDEEIDARTQAIKNPDTYDKYLVNQINPQANKKKRQRKKRSKHKNEKVIEDYTQELLAVQEQKLQQLRDCSKKIQKSHPEIALDKGLKTIDVLKKLLDLRTQDAEEQLLKTRMAITFLKALAGNTPTQDQQNSVIEKKSKPAVPVTLNLSNEVVDFPPAIQEFLTGLNHYCQRKCQRENLSEYRLLFDNKVLFVYDTAHGGFHFDNNLLDIAHTIVASTPKNPIESLFKLTTGSSAIIPYQATDEK